MPNKPWRPCEQADPAEAQRVIDFLAGATSALDGSIDRIGDHTYLCAPMGVSVSQG
jgi:cell division inhibitor SepF